VEREALLFDERQVLGGRVERRAEDDGVELIEPSGSVTQTLALDRSTSGGCLRIPPEQDPLAPQISEANRVAVLVGQLEVGGD
jgi:hypothetical protein